MTDLPAGWRWTTLGELAADEPRSITDGPFGSNLTSAHYTESGARVIRLQNIGDGVFRDAAAYISLEHFETLRKHEVRAGDLLVASLGDNLPRACLMPDIGEPAIVKADCIRIRLRLDVDPRWVLLALQRREVKRWAEGIVKGVGRQRLGLKGIRSIPIPLAPQSEQLRLVQAVNSLWDSLDAGASAAGRANLQASSAGGWVVSAVRRASTEPGFFKRVVGDEGKLPPLVDGWNWGRLGDIADVVGGVTKDSARDTSGFVEVPYLRVANVQRGRLDLSRITAIWVPEKRAIALRLQRGDVLLNEGGDRDKLGRGWVWEGQIENCIHQNHVFRARVKNVQITPRLLSWWANSIGGAWCGKHGRQSVNLASISLSKIKQMPVPLPPLNQQHQIEAEIADQVEAGERLSAAVAAVERRGQALRRSMLDAAFSGLL